MPKFIDYSGKRIGRVNVISLNEMKNGGTKWNCACDCGNKFICWNATFRRGEKFECKNCVIERRRGIDLSGRKFGRWTVLGRVILDGKTNWNCRCDCGKEGIVSNYGLGRKGRSMSCGCLGRKMRSKHVNTTLYPPIHGLSKNKFYAIKTQLIHKCYNENNASFKLFGALGIKVCDLWRNGVRDMYEWAIENGWKEGDVLCLKENEKEFNPLTTFIIEENEFRSQVAQRSGIQITFQGETHSIHKWSNILDVNPEALRKRILKYPSVEQAFGSHFIKQKFVRDPSLTKKVVELYLEGKSQTQIGKIINQNAANVRYHLLKSNIELRKDDIKRNKRTDVKDEEIMELLNQGFSKNSIAKKLNCTYPCIEFRLKKINGVERDRTKG